MNDVATPDGYAVVTEPAMLEFRRLLPGPIERAWAYLTESELRRQWLAAGVMELRPGAEFTLTWRNDELTDPPGQRPPDMSVEHSMACRMLEVDAPRKLAFQFGPHGEVIFTLAPAGSRVLLTLVHRRIPNRDTMVRVSAGWHTHLDLLVARTSGETPAPYWDTHVRLRSEYGSRLPG